MQHLLCPGWDLGWLYGCNWVLKDREDWAENHAKKKWLSFFCWQKKPWERMNFPQSITWTKPSVKVNAEQNLNSIALLKQTCSAALFGYKLKLQELGEPFMSEGEQIDSPLLCRGAEPSHFHNATAKTAIHSLTHYWVCTLCSESQRYSRKQNRRGHCFPEVHMIGIGRDK